MAREGYKRYHTIKLADHGKTVVVCAERHALKDVVRNIRKFSNISHFSAVTTIKVKGLCIERLRRTMGEKVFDKFFEVQAEYDQWKEQYLITRSSNRSLPVGRAILFSSPPININRLNEKVKGA